MAKKIFMITLTLLVIGVGTSFADGNAAIIRQLIKQCEQNLGVKITINQTSDYRTVRRQAELMANMNSSQLDWYGSSTWYIVEMKNSTLSGAARVNEFERLIQNARNQGSFVSRHLTGDAVDISPSTQQVRTWLTGNGISIKDETVDGVNCWHLQLN